MLNGHPDCSVTAVGVTGDVGPGDAKMLQDRRDIILLHPDDCARLGLNENDRVTVRSAIGEMRRILVRPYEQIKAGAALMYYPEANVLLPRTVDPKSKTPAFKNVAIEVRPEAPSPAPAMAAPNLIELTTGSAGA